MKIENMPLFTEYERQFKCKYPGHDSKIVNHKELGLLFIFEFTYNHKSYDCALAAPYPAKNGTVECSLQILSCKYIKDGKAIRTKLDDKTCEFEESRKPMEMNINNCINATKILVEQIEE